MTARSSIVLVNNSTHWTIVLNGSLQKRGIRSVGGCMTVYQTGPSVNY